jgi:5-(carboxyamino)imidazole ribonucleotide synthase
VKVYPRPSVLRIIKNKILQKQYYHQHSIPTADFILTNSLSDIEGHIGFLPAVHKLGEGGYDGRGVQILKNKEDLGKAFNAPSVLEKLIPIDKEIAQMVAVNEKGETALYPPLKCFLIRSEFTRLSTLPGRTWLYKLFIRLKQLPQL